MVEVKSRKGSGICEYRRKELSGFKRGRPSNGLKVICCLLRGPVQAGELGSSINEILDQNSFMGRGKLAAESLRLSKPYYEEILAKLSAIKFTDDGEPVEDWQTAWESQEEELPTED